jgi:hypothetical protein
MQIQKWSTERQMIQHTGVISTWVPLESVYLQGCPTSGVPSPWASHVSTRQVCLDVIHARRDIDTTDVTGSSASCGFGASNADTYDTLHRACRASTFFRVPVAHAFLNGLVRGFWRMACRDAKVNEKLTQGKDVIISKAEQRKIAANVARMHPTSEFDTGFKNIVEYALSVGPARCLLLHDLQAPKHFQESCMELFEGDPA